MWKRILKYTGFGLTGIGLVVGGSLASIYYSSNLTTAVLNYVVTKVPGLSWDKVDGSLSSGLTITNLKYTSQYYGYTPGVKLEADQPLVTTVPTLVDVKVAQAHVKLGLTCLFSKTICLEEVTANSPLVYLAVGSEEKLDKLYPDAYANVSDLDATYNQPAPEASPPFDWTIKLGKLEQHNLQLFMGQNLGLAQKAINYKLVTGDYQQTLSFLEKVKSIGQVATITNQALDSLSSGVDKLQEQANQLLAQGQELASSIETTIAQDNADQKSSSPSVVGATKVKQDKDSASQSTKQATANSAPNNISNSDKQEDKELASRQVKNSNQATGDFILAVGQDKYGEKVNPQPVLKPEVRQQLANSLTYRATLADLDTKLSLGQDFWSYTAPTLAVQYDKLTIANLEFTPKSLTTDKLGIGQLLVSLVTDTTEATVTDSDFLTSQNVVTKKAQEGQQELIAKFQDVIKNNSKYFKSILLPENTQEQLATYFNAPQAGKGYSPSYSNLRNLLQLQPFGTNYTLTPASRTIAPTDELGQALPASEISSKLTESLSYFETPLATSLFKNGYELPLPFTITPQQVVLANLNLANYSYSSAQLLAKQLQASQTKATATTETSNQESGNSETNKEQANQQSTPSDIANSQLLPTAYLDENQLPNLNTYQPLLSLVTGLDYVQDVTLKNLLVTGTLAPTQANLTLKVGNQATSQTSPSANDKTTDKQTVSSAQGKVDTNVGHYNDENNSNNNQLIGDNWSWLAWTLPQDPTVAGATRTGGYSKELVPMNLMTSDVDALLTVNFASATKKLDAFLNAKVQRLPVDLPIAINSEITLSGFLDKELELTLSNKATNAALNLQAKVDLAQAYMPYSLNAQVEKLELADLQVSNTSLVSSGSLQQAKLDLDSSLLLASKPYKIASQLELTPTTISGDVQLDLNRANNTRANTNALHLNLQGEIADSTQLQAKVTTTNLDLVALTGNTNLGNLNANLGVYGVYKSLHDWSLFMPIEQVSVPLKLNDKATAQQVTLAGNLAVDSVAMINLQELQANFLGNKLTGNAHIAPQLDIDLVADANNLEQLVPGLKAKTNAHIQVQQTIAQPAVDLDLAVNGLSYLGADSSQAVTLQELTAKSHIKFDKQLTGNLSVDTKNLTAGDFKLHNANVYYDNPTGSRGNIDLNLESTSANLSSHINNFTVTDLSRFNGELSIANLDVIDAQLYDLTTTQPIVFNYDTADSSLKLEPFAIKNDHLTLASTSQFNYTPQRLTGNFKLNQIDVPYFKSQYKQKLALLGDFDLDANVDINPSDPLGAGSVIKANLSSKHLEYYPDDERDFSLSFANLLLASTISNNRLTVNLDTILKNQGNSSSDNGLIDNIKQATALGDARIHAAVAVDQLRGPGLLSGKVAIDKIDLAMVNKLASSDIIKQGHISANTTLGGTLSRPLIYGQLALQDIKVLSLDVPFVIDNGNLLVNFNGSGANIDGTIKTDSQPILLTGDLAWTDKYAITSNLKMRTNGLVLTLVQFGKATLDSNIDFNFSNNRAVVDGDLVLRDGELTYKSGDASYVQPQGYIMESQDYYKQQAAKLAKNTEIIANNGIDPNPDSGPLNLETNIRAKIGDNLHFVGYGTDARLGGGLDIRYDGRTNNTKIFGQLTIPEGTVDYYGQSLIFEKGNINFNGTSLIPILDLKAKRNPELVVDNVTVGINILGPANRPEISFYSTPNMSQAQQINYLLTGTASDAGDGEIGVQLLSASLTNSLSVIQEVGEKFGIKNLRLSTAKSGINSQVTLSGSVNLARPIRVNYAYGLFNGLSDLSGTINLIPSFFLRLSYGLSWAVDAVYNTRW